MDFYLEVLDSYYECLVTLLKLKNNNCLSLNKMKKIIATFLTVLLTVSVFAQSPQKISYQAVIRNASNALITSHLVGMRISILQGSANGTVVYTETQTPTTNANGLVSIDIGGGAGFSSINWASGTFFLKTETDPTGGSNYTITGTSQMLSVPYALYSKIAENINNVIISFTGDTMFLGTNKIIIPGISGANQLKDIDGNTYKTVKIGTQIWMKENLKTTKYNDGTQIPYSPSDSDYCWFNYDIGFKNVYGAYYHMDDIITNKLCPIGWHVPTLSDPLNPQGDWDILKNYLINNGYGYGGSGDGIGKSLASTSGWTTDLTPGNVGNEQLSNNTSGFTGLPGGVRYTTSHIGFTPVGEQGVWGSSTRKPMPKGMRLYYNESTLWEASFEGSEYVNIRCVRDN